MEQLEHWNKHSKKLSSPRMTKRAIEKNLDGFKLLLIVME